MSDKDSLDIAAWLSDLSSSSDTLPDSDTPVTPTRKRKRVGDHSDLSHKHSRLDCSLTDIALAERSHNIMNTPTPSPQKRDTKKTQTVVTPQTNATRSSYRAASRPPTATPSSSSDARQTLNQDNIRANAARQGMFFEDEESYEKYPSFRARVAQMVFGDRGSAMRAESLRVIKTWRAENATKDEKTYFAGLLPLVTKEKRGAKETRKRTFEDEVVHQARDFKEDGLDRREDCLFLKRLLPLRNPADAAQQGLTTPKPDFVFGLKRPRFPDQEPLLSPETETFIYVAPGLRHAFFSVDNKGPEHGIESAENQAMRSGATMVAARRAFNRKAKGKLGPAMPEVHANAVTATAAATTNSTTTTDACVSPAHAALDAIALGPQANETSQETLGADANSFAFTCSWVPQMANLHVHWCERRENGSTIYHMNLLRGYLMSNDDHLRDFRKDLHNILDWGVDGKRQRMLQEMERDIAENEGGCD